MTIIFERIVPDDYYLFTGMPSCGREAIAMATDYVFTKTLLQAMRESCGRLCSNESFMTMGNILIVCAAMCVS